MTPETNFRRTHWTSSKVDRVHLIGSLTTVRDCPRPEQAGPWEFLLDPPRVCSEVEGFTAGGCVSFQVNHIAGGKLRTRELIHCFGVECAFLEKRSKFGDTSVSRRS